MSDWCCLVYFLLDFSDSHFFKQSLKLFWRHIWILIAYMVTLAPQLFFILFVDRISENALGWLSSFHLLNCLYSITIAHIIQWHLYNITRNIRNLFVFKSYMPINFYKVMTAFLFFKTGSIVLRDTMGLILVGRLVTVGASAELNVEHVDVWAWNLERLQLDLSIVLRPIDLQLAWHLWRLLRSLIPPGPVFGVRIMIKLNRQYTLHIQRLLNHIYIIATNFSIVNRLQFLMTNFLMVSSWHETLVFVVSFMVFHIWCIVLFLHEFILVRWVLMHGLFEVGETMVLVENCLIWLWGNVSVFTAVHFVVTLLAFTYFGFYVCWCSWF